MRAYLLHLGSIARGWVDALRSWRDNPLVRYWGRGSNPGVLAWLGAGFAALLCIALAALLLEALGVSGFSGQLRRREIARTAIALLGFSAVGWLAAVVLPVRLFGLYTFALGFLDRDTRRGRYAAVDDLLAVSALSEQQLLVGLTVQGLRTTWPAVFGGAVALSALLLYDTAHDQPLYWHGWRLAALPPLLALTAVACALSVALWTLLCAALGGSSRGAGSLFGAAGVLAGQALVLCSTPALSSFVWEDEILPGPFMAGYAGLVFTMFLTLVMYVSRRVLWLRYALTAALPFTLIAGVMAVTLLNPQRTPYDALWSLQMVAAPGLQHIAPVSWALASELEGVGMFDGHLEPWRIWMLLPLQLPLLLAAAEFARDALRRRRWETAGREG
jgi:hypothetical protein